MKYIITLLTFLFSFANLIYPQSKKNISGIYNGGICNDEAICGTWVIKNNGTFVFVNFENKNLRNIGMGYWQFINDSLIKFIFKGSKYAILEKTKSDYLAETKGSFDSLYINGQLRDQYGNGIEFVSIAINEKNAIISDQNGYFKITLPLNLEHTKLTFIKKINGFIPVEFFLSPTNNYHTLNLMIPVVESTTCMPVNYSNSLKQSLIKGDTIILHLNNNKSEKNNKYALGISFTGKDSKGVINNLETAKKNQPYLKLNITEIIELIKK